MSENWDLGRATKAVLEGTGDPEAPVKRGRGRPRTRPVDEERRLILTAAMQVLTEVGYGGATIEAIARTAGVQRRSIYEQFNDRDTLLVTAMDAVLDEVFGQFTDVLGAAAGLPVAEYLRFTMKRGIEIMANEPGFRAVVAAAYVGGDEPTAVRARAARTLMEEAVMASIVEHFASVGIDDPVLARLHASTSVALLATLSLRAGAEPDWDIDRVADYVADVILGGQAYLDGNLPSTPPFSRPHRS